MNYLVSVSELAKLLQEKSVLLFDCRFNLMDPEAGKLAWLESHIPGARYVNLNVDLSSPHIPGVTGRHPLPDRDSWINQVKQWGISPEQRVIMYDDAGGAFAARMWWLLRWIGHDNAAVLDGGWQAWLESGGEISTLPPEPRAVADYDYVSLPPLTRSIEVADIDADQQLLLDARELKRFIGEVEPIDPVAGHIPGAICSPMSNNLDDRGHFKSVAGLREKFAEAGATEKTVVCYCGSGVTAAHNILAMRIAGLQEPALYAGSWSEWITDSRRPVARNTDQENK